MRILIIEDDPEISGFLNDHLPAHGFVVDLASVGEEGLNLSRQNDYDLVVLDLHLPDITGEHVVAEMYKQKHIPPILMLTVVGDSETKTRLLWAGADDYLAKPFSFEELLARIHVLLRRSRVTIPDVLQIEDLVLDVRTQTVRRGEWDIACTAKEFLLLAYLMRNAGSIISKSSLIEHAWNASADPFSNVIEMHIMNMRKKLGSPVLIHTKRGRGYIIG